MSLKCSALMARTPMQELGECLMTFYGKNGAILGVSAPFAFDDGGRIGCFDARPRIRFEISEPGLATKFIVRSTTNPKLWISGKIGSRRGDNPELMMNTRHLVRGVTVSVDFFRIGRDEE